MKKTLLITLVFLIIVSICNMVNAYSTSKYSIDFPEYYLQMTEDSFSDANGNTISIQVSKGDSGENPYTQENLERLVNEIYNNVDAYKEQIAASLKETYGNYYSDEQIKAYVDAFRCKSIDTKEITTVSKNKYKCFHIVANYEMGDYSYYCKQYSIISKDEMYTITISAKEKEDLFPQDVSDAIDSFTITNYEEPKASTNKTGDIIKYIGIGAGCGALAGVLSYVINKNRKKNGIN